jgi:hypothetical protein
METPGICGVSGAAFRAAESAEDMRKFLGRLPQTPPAFLKESGAKNFLILDLGNG